VVGGGDSNLRRISRGEGATAGVAGGEGSTEGEGGGRAVAGGGGEASGWATWRTTGRVARSPSRNRVTPSFSCWKR
jgi:hypothetical protein